MARMKGENLPSEDTKIGLTDFPGIIELITKFDLLSKKAWLHTGTVRFFRNESNLFNLVLQDCFGGLREAGEAAFSFIYFCLLVRSTD